jgi:hypothetical protein
MAELISMKTNFAGIYKQLQQLEQSVADKAVVRALNKTVDQGRTAMARQITAEFNVTRQRAINGLQVEHARNRAGQLRLTVTLLAANKGNRNEGRSMNLINFVENKVSLAEMKRRRKAGTLKTLRVKIKRKGGAKMVEGAFIATNKKTGGTAVFERETQARYPIKALTTVGIPSMFNTRRINQVVRQVMLDRFPANFERELRAVLGGWAGRRR